MYYDNKYKNGKRYYPNLVKTEEYDNIVKELNKDKPESGI